MRKLAAFLLVLAPALHAQFSQKPPDAVVPVVGSTQGLAGSNFKTELQLANPTGTRMEGWIVLQPGVIARRYDLAPRATLSYADIVADLGSTGLLSLDIYADNGAVPAVVARAYDDQPEGTTGVTVPAVRAAEILARNDVAALIVPRDLTLYRFNIGVRSLDTGATIQMAVRDASGTERHYFDLTLPANQFLQRAGELLIGTPLRPNDSIEVKIAAGSAIVYATTVDNRTNDSSIQVLRK